VTVFISTHFMDEAERCDRLALMHAGRVLAINTPAGLISEADADNLEEAFIGYMQRAAALSDSEEGGQLHPGCDEVSALISTQEGAVGRRRKIARRCPSVCAVRFTRLTFWCPS